MVFSVATFPLVLFSSEVVLFSVREGGFSLIEVLVAAGVSVVVLGGTTKILSTAIQSSRLTSISVSEQELRNTVGISLGEPNCQINLDPSEITGSDSAKGIGSLALLSAGELVITSGSTFKNDLDIVKMEVLGDSASDPLSGITERSLVVYYKKRDMGDLSTMGGKTCSVSNQEGCYFIHCSLEYELQTGTPPSGPSVKTCNALNCLGYDLDTVAGKECGVNEHLVGFDTSGKEVCGPSQVSQACGANKYLVGFDDKGKVICEKSQSGEKCDPNEYLVGYDDKGEKICAQSQSGQECAVGKYLVGYDSAGVMICADEPTRKSCDPGEYLAGFRSDGSKICKQYVATQYCGRRQYLRGFDSEGNKVCSSFPGARVIFVPRPPPPHRLLHPLREGLHQL